MAWSNPFRYQDENTRICWDYTFQITDQHLTPEQAHPMKFSYDVLGEQALERLDAISPAPRSALPRNSSRYAEKTNANADPGHDDSPLPRRDLYALLREHAEQDQILGRLWTEVNTVPAWVDWSQIARGQEVFYRYGGPILTGLAYQSLLGGMVRRLRLGVGTCGLSNHGDLGRKSCGRDTCTDRRILTPCGKTSAFRNHSTPTSMHTIPAIHTTRGRGPCLIYPRPLVARRRSTTNNEVSPAKARILRCGKMGNTDQ